MKRVLRIEGQGKVKDVGLGELATMPAAENVHSMVALIEALIPHGLKAVAEALKDEVIALAGEQYRRKSGRPAPNLMNSMNPTNRKNSSYGFASRGEI